MWLEIFVGFCGRVKSIYVSAAWHTCWHDCCCCCRYAPRCPMSACGKADSIVSWCSHGSSGFYTYPQQYWHQIHDIEFPQSFTPDPLTFTCTPHHKPTGAPTPPEPSRSSSA